MIPFIQALSRLAGNRHSDGVSSLVSAEDRKAIIDGCYDLMTASRSALSPSSDDQIAERDKAALVAERDAAITALQPFAAFAEKARRYVQGRADFGGSPMMPTKQFRLVDFELAEKIVNAAALACPTERKE